MPPPPVKKKISIKPFKDLPQLPKSLEEDQWNCVTTALDVIFTFSASSHKEHSFSCERVYRTVEDMCLQNLGAQLYDRLRAVCHNYSQKAVATLQSAVGTMDNQLFLRNIVAAWRHHFDAITMVRHTFMYLDRTYVLQHTGTRSLWALGVDAFRTSLDAQPKLLEVGVLGFLQAMQQERRGDAIDRGVLTGFTQLVTTIGYYAKALEPAVLKETEEFYTLEGVAAVQSADFDAPTYLHKVATRLEEEAQRVKVYLDPTTRRKVDVILQTKLIGDHCAAIVERGAHLMFQSHEVAHLKLLYKLLLLPHVKQVDLLRDRFKKYIFDTGSEVVTSKEMQDEMVPTLLMLKAKIDEVTANAFDGDDAFTMAMRESFEGCFRRGQNKPSELLAKHVDSYLREGQKGSEHEVETALDKAMELFNYVPNKDVFEAFYTKDFAKRLLLQRSASVEYEKSMISRLKQICGTGVSMKLEGMLKDIDLSKDLMASMRETYQSTSLELFAYVLTQGYWPSYPVVTFKVPDELQQHLNTFTQYYVGKHSSRRLAWQHPLSQCIVKGHYPKSRKEFSVSFQQALVMLLFNDSNEVTFGDIKRDTGMDATDAARTVMSLCIGSAKVLKRTLESGHPVNIGDDETFVYVENFTHRLVRIKINQLQMKETAQEVQQTTERVFADRQHSVDAAIVRLMKARKSSHHANLVAQVQEQLKFIVQPADMKKRIEVMIEREYLRRDDNDKSLYHYVA